MRLCDIARVLKCQQDLENMTVLKKKTSSAKCRIPVYPTSHTFAKQWLSRKPTFSHSAEAIG